MKRLFWHFKVELKKVISFFLNKKKEKLMRFHYRKVVEYLRTLNGFGKIKPIFVETWKYYGFDHVRFSLLVTFKSKPYIAKVVKGWDERTRNGIKVFDTYSKLFDFVPKGQELKHLDYVINLNEFIDSFTFDKARIYCDASSFNYVLTQLCEILDKLNEFKIVHCDIDDSNILIQKRTYKVFIVDFDTCNSSILDLHNDTFPTNALRQSSENCDIYDDAWAIMQLLNKVRFVDVKSLPSYKELENRIGQNTYIINK